MYIYAKGVRECVLLCKNARTSEVLGAFKKFLKKHPTYFEPVIEKEKVVIGNMYNALALYHFLQYQEELEHGIECRSFKQNVKYIKELMI